MKKIKTMALIGLVASGFALLAACGRGIDSPTGFSIDVDNKLSWEAVSGARNYILEIVNVETGEKEEKSSRSTNYSLSWLEEGEYEIRIKAIAGDKNAEDSKWSEICYFSKGYETGCIYSLVNNIEYEILKYGTASGDVIIEDEYRGKPVTSIAGSAFKGCRDVKNVVVGKNVTSIGERAFWNCSNLETITLPDALTTIGEAAFQSCSKLKEISIPDAVTQLEKNTFIYCRAMESVDLGSGLEIIGDSAFSDCSALTEVTIPDSVTYIDKYAFTANDLLETVTIGSGVQQIGEHAFYDCEKLTEIKFAENGAMTFLGADVFSECPALETVTLPEGLKEIGAEAFYLCSNLTTVELPDSLEFIDVDAFNATKLYKDAIEAGDTFIYVDDWLIHCTQKATLVELTADMIATNSAGEPVVGIADEVFFKFEKLEKITLPSSLKHLGRYAFEKCPVLWSIDLSQSSIETISLGAFARCPVLTTLRLMKADGSSSIKRIGEYAFRECTSLNNNAFGAKVLPDTIESIGAYAFYETGMWENPDEYGIVYADNWVVGFNKTEVIPGLDSPPPGIDPDALPEGWDEDLVIDMPLGDITLKSDTVGIAEYAFLECDTLTAVIGLNTVRYIGRAAFSKCTALERVNLNANLRVIEPYTFNNCTALFDITLPSRLTTVGRGAFQNCDALNALDFSDTQLETIEPYAFYGCGNVEEIAFNEDVVSIGEYAFYKCTMLKELEIPDSVETLGRRAFAKCEFLKKVTLGTGIDTIPERAFQNCVSLKEIVIPANVTTIEDYAFYKSTGLEKIVLEEGITKIGNFAFYGVEKLQRVALPESVTEIGKYAFKGCNMLQSVTLGDNIETIGAHAFYGAKQATIYVEAESIPEGWHARWNSSYRPVIWGCTLSEDNSYVVSVTITEDTVFSKKATDVIVSPKRAGYTFAGWATEEGGEVVYEASKIGKAPVGTTLYAVWTEGDEPLIVVPEEPENTDSSGSSASAA